MKALIQKKIEYEPNFKGTESLSDNLSAYRTIATTIYFIGIPIYYAIRKLSKEQSTL